MRRLWIIALLLPLIALVGCGTHRVRTHHVHSSCRPTSMGAAQRCKTGLRLLSPRSAPAGQTGIDLSNNDPSNGRWTTIRRFASFAFFKVSEGTGFIDRTALRMAREARAAGLFVGGYDFQHVCGSNPVSEARVFVSAARAAGLLTGAGVLPPTADFEAGSGCNAKVWLSAWSSTVRRLVPDIVYSDPGFYIPSVGCFSNADYGWVADLGAFQALCGLKTVFHQYSFSAWDGVASVDGDVFLGSYAQLSALAHETPPPLTHKQKNVLLQKARARRSLERAFLARHHCRQPPWHVAVGLSGRPNGRYQHACHVELHNGRVTNHIIHTLGGK